jgi:hypothetical protein
MQSAVECRVGRGVAITERHNAFRDIVYWMAKELGLDVVREPHSPIRVPGAEGCRPDLLLETGRGVETYTWMSSGHLLWRGPMWRCVPRVGWRLRRLYKSCPPIGIS